MQTALAGMTSTPLLVVALALGTLLLEDLAIAAGASLATQGALSWELAFVAVGGGIAIGDLGLYALGAAARRVGAIERRLVGPRSAVLHDRLARRLPSAVLLARVIPGLRLVTYTTSGFVRVSFARFTGWVVLATGMWTIGLFALGSVLGDWLAQTLAIPAPLAVALPVIVFALAVPLLRRGASR